MKRKIKMPRIKNEDNPLHIKFEPDMAEVMRRFDKDMEEKIESPDDVRWALLKKPQKFTPKLNIFEGYPLSVNKFLSKQVVILGFSGSGKTNLVAAICEELLYVKPPLSLSIVDCVGDFVSIKELPGMKDIITIVGNTEESEFKIPRNADEVERFATDIASSVIKRQKAAIIDFSQPTEENIQYIFLNAYLKRIMRLAASLYKSGRKSVHIIILDEAQRFIPRMTGRNQLLIDVKNIVSKIAKEGRKYGVSSILATQKNQDADLSTLSQARTLVLMRVNSRPDWELYSKLYGESFRLIHDITTAFKAGEVLWFPSEGEKIPVPKFDAEGNFMGITQPLRARKRDSFHPSRTPDFSDHLAFAKRAELERKKDEKQEGDQEKGEVEEKKEWNEEENASEKDDES
jgi:hypothetical protein